MSKMMSKPQNVYQKAKLKFVEKAKKLEQKLEEIKDEQEITQALMEQLVVQTGFHGALNELRQAEEDLIVWAHATIKHESTYKEYKEQFDMLFKKIPHDEEARKIIIELAMKVR